MMAAPFWSTQSAHQSVADWLGWLDTWIPQIWLGFTLLGVVRVVYLLSVYLRQANLRQAVGLAPAGASLGLHGRTVQPSVSTLVLGAFAALGLLAWIVIALKGGPGQALWLKWDAACQHWAQTRLPPEWRSFLQGLTDLGDVIFVALLTLAGALWLAWRRRWLDVQVLVFFSLFTGLLVRVLKLAFDRTRPENVHDLVVSGASFPSGHSAGSLLVYVLLALLLPMRLPMQFRMCAAIAAVCGAVAIGVSRILLSVHWLSDVVAGMALGAFGVLAAVAVLRGLQQARG